MSFSTDPSHHLSKADQRFWEEVRPAEILHYRSLWLRIHSNNEKDEIWLYEELARTCSRLKRAKKVRDEFEAENNPQPPKTTPVPAPAPTAPPGSEMRAGIDSIIARVNRKNS